MKAQTLRSLVRGMRFPLFLIPFNMMSSRLSFHTTQCNTCNHYQRASLTREASLTHVATVMPPPHLLRRARRASGGASALSSREATSASVRSRLVSNADQGERVRGRPVPSSLDWCQCVVCLEEAVLRVRRLAYRKTIVLVVLSLRFIHIAQVRPVQNAETVTFGYRTT